MRRPGLRRGKICRRRNRARRPAPLRAAARSFRLWRQLVRAVGPILAEAGRHAGRLIESARIAISGLNSRAWPAAAGRLSRVRDMANAMGARTLSEVGNWFSAAVRSLFLARRTALRLGWHLRSVFLRIPVRRTLLKPQALGAALAMVAVLLALGVYTARDGKRMAPTVNTALRQPDGLPAYALRSDRWDREEARPTIAPDAFETEFAFVAKRAAADREPRAVANARPTTDGGTGAGSTTAELDNQLEENVLAALPLLQMPESETDSAGADEATAGLPTIPEPRPTLAPPQWLANAVEVHDHGNGPVIAIVIDDAGVAVARTDRAIELPAPVTIAFIPYSRSLDRQTREARRRGHELLVHIPMEPVNETVDPGPNALLTSLDRDEILRRVEWSLGRFEGYVGVNNHMGSKFMARPDLVEPVLSLLQSRGLLFLDSRTDARTVGRGLARDRGMPNTVRDVFLDNELTVEAVAAQLEQVERVARRQGYAVAIGHPHDVTVDMLHDWIPDARRRGFRFVPVSAVVRRDYGPPSALAAAPGGSETDGLLGGAQ